MPQINLLKENRSNTNDIVRVGVSVANIVFMVVIAGLLAYYGWMYYATQKNSQQAASLQSQISSAKQSAVQLPDRQELLVRQAQLKALQDILSKHPYWSAILPKLAQVTLKQSNYMSVKVLNSGEIGLSVEVPNTEELDKFLQIFDIGDYNKYFYNVRISSISNDQRGQKIGTRFELKMNYNTDLLKFSAVSNPSSN